MRQNVGRYGLGVTLLGLSAILLLASLGAALGIGPLQAPTSEAVAASSSSDDGGLTLAADLHLSAAGLTVDRELAADLPSTRTLPVPGFTVDRDVDATEKVPVDAPVEADLGVDLAMGSHAKRATSEAGTASVASANAVVVPTAGVFALAAVAVAGAGLLALLWTPLKGAAHKVFILPVVALYAKVARAEVFENEVRERIFGHIRDRPGIAATDLSRAANVAWGTTIYHLDVLEQTRMVSSIREGRHRRYFLNGAALDNTKEAVAILQNTVTASVAASVRTAPGVTQKDLALATNMSPQALHWHLVRLVGAGIVRKEREGRVVRHFLTAS